jgi:hypothetical protein
MCLAVELGDEVAKVLTPLFIKIESLEQAAGIFKPVKRREIEIWRKAQKKQYANSIKMHCERGGTVTRKSKTEQRWAWNGKRWVKK